MITILADAAAIDPISWPQAIVMIVGILVFGFILYMILR